MKSKYKLVLMFLTIILLIIMCKVILSPNHLNYSLKINKNKFNIREEYSKDYTYIKININNKVYSLYVNDKGRKIIDNIYYYKDNTYECLLPIINKSTKTDMMCYSGKTIYNYYNIKNKDEALDNYVSSIKEYNIENFIDNTDKFSKINYIKFYNNIDKKVAITTYDGLISNYNNIKLFNKDVYNNIISAFIDKYYIIADYNKSYEFNEFLVINLENQESFKIKSKYDISFDSYVQGIVDNKLYIYDKDNNSQYEIDIDKKRVNLLSNSKKIKVYKNHSWGYVSKNSEDIYFENEEESLSLDSFDHVIKYGNYYYLFKKVNKSYELYRSDINNIKVYKYLITVPTIKINYNEDYIYYVDGNKLYYYSDSTGLKTILENPELEFNETIKYYIY